MLHLNKYSFKEETGFEMGGKWPNAAYMCAIATKRTSGKWSLEMNLVVLKSEEWASHHVTFQPCNITSHMAFDCEDGV